MKSFKENITDLARLAILSTVLVAGMSFGQAWDTADCNPPNCNVPPPINVSSAPQEKTGPLIVGGLGVTGGLSIKDGTNTASGKVLTLTDPSTGAAQWVTAPGINSLGVKDCYVAKPDRFASFIAVDGFYLKALYKYTDDSWDGYGAMYCRADGTIDDPILLTAQALHAACPWGWNRIRCTTITETYPAGVVSGY